MSMLDELLAMIAPCTAAMSHDPQGRTVLRWASARYPEVCTVVGMDGDSALRQALGKELAHGSTIPSPGYHDVLDSEEGGL